MVSGTVYFKFAKDNSEIQISAQKTPKSRKLRFFLEDIVLQGNVGMVEFINIFYFLNLKISVYLCTTSLPQDITIFNEHYKTSYLA